jgi:antitoxin component YwqK of YwqJK toxin-antitoxin module
MKRILAPILLLTLLFPSLAFGETMNDLVKRDGLYYKKFSTVPFTGKTTGQRQRTFKDGKNLAEWNGVYVRYHGNGQLESKGTYKDSKKDGPWVYYHKNGKLSQKGTFNDGKKDGPFVAYDNGRLAEKGTYKNDKKNGPYLTYHGNGQLESKGTYKDDKKDGPWVFYTDNGTKRFIKEKVFDLVIDEGSGTYKDGKKVK